MKIKNTAGTQRCGGVFFSPFRSCLILFDVVRYSCPPIKLDRTIKKQNHKEALQTPLPQQKIKVYESRCKR